MNKIEELIKEYCPDGVEYKELGEICISLPKGTLKKIANIQLLILAKDYTVIILIIIMKEIQLLLLQEENMLVISLL